MRVDIVVFLSLLLIALTFSSFKYQRIYNQSNILIQTHHQIVEMGCSRSQRTIIK